MKMFFSAVFGLILVFGASGSASAQRAPQLANHNSAGAFQASVEQLLLTKLNSFRASKGLARLIADSRFAGAARAHALDMAKRNTLGHNDANGLDFGGRMQKIQGGQMHLTTMGENAAMMYPVRSVSAVGNTLFNSWLNSPPHLANMQRADFKRVATGVVYLGDKAYADQIFIGSPLAR